MIVQFTYQKSSFDVQFSIIKTPDSGLNSTGMQRLQTSC